MKATTEIDPQLVKKLREKTNAGMMDCKGALVEAGGDFAKAEAILRTKGIASASKKASRATREGIVASYIHQQGKVGVLVEVNCETYKAQAKGKPENVVEKIVDGKLDKFFSTICLLEQGFIKNPDQTIGDLVKAKIAELGENIVIRRFTRYLMGEPLPTES